MGKFPRKVTRWVCENCDENWDTEVEAQECCPTMVEELDRWQCVDCDEIHEEREDAYSCCE